MSKNFRLEILTPGRELLKAEVSEVVLPAQDGECGILAEHEDFVGLVGTGPLKIVKGGNDYWFMVSRGVFEVRSGEVTVFASLAEKADEVKVDEAKSKVTELEKLFADHQKFDPDSYPAQKIAYDQNRARLEIHRRTDLVN